MLESHRQEIAKLEALYAGNPGGRVFVHLAEALRKGGEHERARSILQEGLARHPDSASGFVVLGRLLTDMGETDEAETAFRQVLHLDGGNLVALRCLGDLARESGRREEAIDLYRELIARNPSSDDVAFQLRTLELVHADAAPPPDDEWSSEDRTPLPVEAGSTVTPDVGERAAAAEPEFGVIDRAALPGDPADFGNVVPAAFVPDETPETNPIDDDAIALSESSAASLELEDFGSSEPEASAAEINLLSAAPEHGEWAGASTADAELPPAARQPEAPVDQPVAAGAEAADEPGWSAVPVASDLADQDLPAAGADDEVVLDDWVAADVTALEYDELLDVSDLVGSDREVVEDAAADLADLAPRPEFAVADEPATLTFDAVIEPEPEDRETERPAAEVAAALPMFAEEPAPVEVGSSALYDDSAAPVAPEPPEPQLPAAPPGAFEAPTSEEPLEPMWGQAPYLEPAWAGDAETDLESLLPGASDVASEPFGFEVETPAAANVPDELPFRAPDAPLPEAGPEAAPEEAVAQSEGGRDAVAPGTGGLAAVSGDVVTETLADLYLSQGFAERAADVYRALLRAQPDNERLLAKLAQAESTRDPAHEDAGEVWLRGVESAWTGGAGAAGGETTPYTWTEREDSEEGLPIRAYLRELVGWGGIAPEETHGPEAESSEPAAPETTAEPSLPWEQFEATAASMEPDPWSLEAAPAETAASEVAEAAAAPWSQPPVEDEVVSPAPDPWAELPDTPADPWLAPEPAGIDPPAPTRAAAGNPVEAAFFEWFDQPALPAGGAAADSPRAAVPAPVAVETESSDEEDEDLEMFRAWLQSLKK